MLNLYSLTPTEDGHNFTAVSGLTYSLYFGCHYLKDDNGKDIKTTSFGFSHEPRAVRNRIYDEKIKNTIQYVVLEFFQKNPDTGLIFVCNNADRYGRHRYITFSKWFKEVDAPIEKFDCGEIHTKGGFYTSFLVRPDNPLKEYYVDAFYLTIYEYFPGISQSEFESTDIVFFQ
ncbi:DUF6169 family protein [Chitinophaga sp. S165]|uniref:DUF6169 family protein n=1 Tax=Chitinophaga sp. S165 TaxID=2135462 RepID=UPI000D70FBD9|nr:DUF6169 family protein [Chitinophaga sp. S165]PWV47469.1 hypothetical protein C7475_10836 [Chitinophaga sp. S165]